MTHSGQSPRMANHSPEPFVEVHPTDAASLGLSGGSFARLRSSHGTCVLKVVITENQRRGCLFAPIHWSGDTASSARIGELVTPANDPYSGQPKQGDAGNSSLSRLLIVVLRWPAERRRCRPAHGGRERRSTMASACRSQAMTNLSPGARGAAALLGADELADILLRTSRGLSRGRFRRGQAGGLPLPR